ncbi:hypothetical protein QJS10_CPB19g00845 [Acorus calamus]|uniref:Uncharacterized protein n=1 Tax=Acorus calamus TaxID=4465 RepID=A0AAV9CGC4_ACOCL|nr:hypothetical protein QJS10_CPB19g00845 [Acorus calamus]
MAEPFKELMGGTIGLVKMASILKIDTTNPHQAGYDSLMTGKVFLAIRKKFKLDEDKFRGNLWGLPSANPLIELFFDDGKKMRVIPSYWD